MQNNTIGGGAPLSAVFGTQQDQDRYLRDQDNQQQGQGQGNQGVTPEQLMQAIQRLHNEMGYTRRKVEELERKGVEVPAELQNRLDALLEQQEELKLDGMTADEQLAYWRNKAQGNDEGGGQGGVKDSDIQALVNQQYPSALRALQQYAERDLGIVLAPEIEAQVRNLPIDAVSGQPDWPGWIANGQAYLRRYAQAARQQQQGGQQTPARQAGAALGSNSRGAAPSTGSRPDFYTASAEELAVAAINEEKASGRRRYTSA